DFNEHPYSSLPPTHDENTSSPQTRLKPTPFLTYSPLAAMFEAWHKIELFAGLQDRHDKKPLSVSSFSHTSQRFHTNNHNPSVIAPYWKKRTTLTTLEWTKFFQWLGTKRSIMPHFTEWYYHLQVGTPYYNFWDRCRLCSHESEHAGVTHVFFQCPGSKMICQQSISLPPSFLSTQYLINKLSTLSSE
ncbi:hypothetical protein CANARDRAFT_30460, partial [[Candida] arabinofermentans NRRL YB-2248]